MYSHGTLDDCPSLVTLHQPQDDRGDRRQSRRTGNLRLLRLMPLLSSVSFSPVRTQAGLNSNWKLDQPLSICLRLEDFTTTHFKVKIHPHRSTLLCLVISSHGACWELPLLGFCFDFRFPRETSKLRKRVSLPDLM